MTFKSQPTNLLAPVSFKDSKHTKNLEEVLSFAGFLHFLERHFLPWFGGAGRGLTPSRTFCLPAPPRVQEGKIRWQQGSVPGLYWDEQVISGVPRD